MPDRSLTLQLRLEIARDNESAISSFYFFNVRT